MIEKGDSMEVYHIILLSVPIHSTVICTVLLYVQRGNVCRQVMVFP